MLFKTSLIPYHDVKFFNEKYRIYDALESYPTGPKRLGRTTAAATTGPAQQPRPASSTPARHFWPPADRSQSKSTSPATSVAMTTCAELHESGPGGRYDRAGSITWLGAPYPVSVRSTGGGAKNDAWTQMRKQLLNTEMQPARHTEAAFGAALLAANAFNSH